MTEKFMRYIKIAAAMAVLSPTPAFGQGTVTDAMKPIMAATRIFALENHLHGDIAVAGEDEGHIGDRFEVNRAPGEKCTFMMRHRDGPVIESISFDRLSGEYKVRPQDGYARVVIAGRSGAQCEISGQTKKCSASLDMLLSRDGSSPTELDLAVRALRYIFATACRAADLPL